ncbi:hypothetical protein AK830_g3464 [Neonectria ditissima]|uniref:Uncharacterized protein n=1 Tax=Neonectria ditissima TaxID=78410 RepID=A0A0P7BQ70_9HYPO|nr:hypothetical protein AK830_g3464 [Neonectria ditissima]
MAHAAQQGYKVTRFGTRVGKFGDQSYPRTGSHRDLVPADDVHNESIIDEPSPPAQSGPSFTSFSQPYMHHATALGISVFFVIIKECLKFVLVCVQMSDYGRAKNHGSESTPRPKAREDPVAQRPQNRMLCVSASTAPERSSSKKPDPHRPLPSRLRTLATTSSRPLLLATTMM